VPAEPVAALERATLTVGTVGRVVPEKDHGNLIAAVRQLKDRGCSLRVVVVGDGPELDDVKVRVDQVGLAGVFEFPGLVEDVERWYRELDVFVLSSRQEGQPVALLEAMAIGLPCVATDVGAIAATLESGREGTVVEPGSPTALAEGILGYLESLPLRAEHGRAARERVRREFSIEAVAARHLDEYRRILARKRPWAEVAGP
jgi:glycosyltransferase involved in cell wall biosynthesis